MSLYHFSVKLISRGKGQTVVGSAAYISGQKLHNDYYEEIHDADCHPKRPSVPCSAVSV